MYKNVIIINKNTPPPLQALVNINDIGYPVLGPCVFWQNI
jgi:hypothetical protein